MSDNRTTRWVADVQRVLNEVGGERGRQEVKWGEQNHPNGTGGTRSLLRDAYEPNLDLRTGAELAAIFTARTDRLAAAGRLTYEAILTEEWAEAIACDDPAELRAELVQVAAVAVAWVQKIDREQGAGITVTAIRSQPNPELWLTDAGHVWQRCDDGSLRCINGTDQPEDESDVRRRFGRLRRLVPESEAGQ
ncbi:hypothetical protein [Desertihabitans brevis]|uniref:hypothetical protein n=1 Tax=Desertihabitans brevis TaxID=2268447 RepID=UPI0018F4C054|nr:hypothetical protein [Desertihabitans brevis]